MGEGNFLITLYSGTPGSGKSLHTARRIYYSCKFGKTVIGNFEIDKGKLKGKGEYYYINNAHLTPDVLIKYSGIFFGGKRVKEGSILLIIDECQLLFNAREWNKKGRDNWLSFFTQHRKYGYDIILVAQFDRMVDRQIRSLIEYEFIHRKINNIGKWGKIFSLIAMGNLFVSVEYYYPLKERLGSEFFKAHKKFYSLYDTFNSFQN